MDKRDETETDSCARRRQHTHQPRNNRVNLRLSNEELSTLQQRAQQADLATGTYIIQRALSVDEGIPVGRDDASIDLRILWELIALNRQLAHHDNADSELVNRIEDLIVEVASYIRQSSGR